MLNYGWGTGYGIMWLKKKYEILEFNSRKERKQKYPNNNIDNNNNQNNNLIKSVKSDLFNF